MKRHYAVTVKYKTGRVIKYEEFLSQKKMLKKIVELNMSPHVWYAYYREVDEIL